MSGFYDDGDYNDINHNRVITIIIVCSVYHDDPRVNVDFLESIETRSKLGP